MDWNIFREPKHWHHCMHGLTRSFRNAWSLAPRRWTAKPGDEFENNAFRNAYMLYHVVNWEVATLHGLVKQMSPIALTYRLIDRRFYQCCTLALTPVWLLEKELWLRVTNRLADIGKWLSSHLWSMVLRERLQGKRELFPMEDVVPKTRETTSTFTWSFKKREALWRGTTRTERW